MYFPLRDGYRLRYHVIGKGSPVVLLHGFGLNASQWLPHAYMRSGKYSFIIPDCRGHGRSKIPFHPEQNPLELLVDDLDQLISHLGLENFKLVGYSMGALIGLGYTSWVRNPKQRSYMHIELGAKFHSDTHYNYGFNESFKIKTQQLLDILPASLSELDQNYKACKNFKKAFRNLLRYLLEHAFPSGHLKQLVQRLPEIALTPWLPEWRFTAHLFSWLLEEGYDFLPELKQLKLPVHILAGKHSEYFPYESALTMQEYISDPTLTSFERSGHALMLTEPLLFTKTLTKFIEA